MGEFAQVKSCVSHGVSVHLVSFRWVLQVPLTIILLQYDVTLYPTLEFILLTLPLFNKNTEFLPGPEQIFLLRPYAC
jgi:hypothetical protein